MPTQQAAEPATTPLASEVADSAKTAPSENLGHYSAAVSECERPAEAIDRLTRERDEAQSERDHYQSVADGTMDANERARAERDQACRELAECQQARDALAQDLARITAERDGLTRVVADRMREVRQERDDLARELAECQQARDALARQAERDAEAWLRWRSRPPSWGRVRCINPWGGIEPGECGTLQPLPLPDASGAWIEWDSGTLHWVEAGHYVTQAAEAESWWHVDPLLTAWAQEIRTRPTPPTPVEWALLQAVEVAK